MELIDRYLHAVKGFLPKAQQADIIKELAANIRAQVEDRESELGRALNESEQETLLKEYGPPVRLALQYGSRRALIGPAMLPVYWYTLKISFGILLVVCGVLPLIARLSSGNPAGLANPLSLFLPAAAYTFTCMTLVFAGLDYCVAKYKLGEKLRSDWDPRSLPAVPKDDSGSSQIKKVCKLALSIVAGLWWLLALRHPVLILGPTFGLIALSPVWESFYASFVVLTLLGVVQHWMEIFRSQWTALVMTAKLAATGGGALVCYLILRNGDLVRAVSLPSVDGLLPVYNTALQLGMAITGIAFAVSFFQTLWNALRHHPRGLASSVS